MAGGQGGNEISVVYFVENRYNEKTEKMRRVGVDMDDEMTRLIAVGEAGDSKAQYKLGLCYYHGQGVERDYHQAAEWLEKAAAQGDFAANDMLGACYYLMGLDYYCGTDREQDYEKAIGYFRESAERGLLEAQYAMGLNYALGIGVEKDYQQGFAWLMAAIEQEEDTPAYLVQNICQQYGKPGVVKKRVVGFKKNNK